MRYEPVDLFAAVSGEMGLSFDSEDDLQTFLSEVSKSVQSSQVNPNMLHGRRVEHMFKYVALGLGKCEAIKSEDNGDFHAKEPEKYQIPDYNLVLEDGSRILVEVKNHHSYDLRSDFSIRKTDFKRLEKYSQLMGQTLKIALFFSQRGIWTLLSKDDFWSDGNRLKIDCLTAMAKCEMALLGDRVIGVKSILTMEFVWSEPVPIVNDQENGILKDINFFCDGASIEEDLDKYIAFYLIRYGDWPISESVAQLDDEGNCSSIIFDCRPEAPTHNQGFDVIGRLSSMIASAYTEATVERGKVVRLAPEADPSKFVSIIPRKHISHALPLWQLEIQKNDTFQGRVPMLNES